MKMKYDPEVDAAYISFKKGNSRVTTIRINEDVAVDLGENEEIVGIEILDASESRIRKFCSGIIFCCAAAEISSRPSISYVKCQCLTPPNFELATLDFSSFMPFFFISAPPFC